MSNTLPRISLDEDVEDADWIKHNRWDLPTTVAGLLKALGVEAGTPAEKRSAVARLMRLPAGSMMPASLRRSLRQARLL